jgi:hypothetical protein
MGYEVHITRRNDWFDDEGPVITLEEWLHYVRHDPEMRLEGYAEADLEDGGAVRIESDGLCVWTRYSGHGVDGNMAWFTYADDRIDVKNPDVEMLVKMGSIAQVLSAKVQGDDGERYDLAGNIVGALSALARQESPDRNWRHWFRERVQRMKAFGKTFPVSRGRRPKL